MLLNKKEKKKKNQQTKSIANQNSSMREKEKKNENCHVAMPRETKHHKITLLYYMWSVFVKELRFLQ